MWGWSGRVYCRCLPGLLGFYHGDPRGFWASGDPRTGFEDVCTTLAKIFTQHGKGLDGKFFGRTFRPWVQQLKCSSRSTVQQRKFFFSFVSRKCVVRPSGSNSFLLVRKSSEDHVLHIPSSRQSSQQFVDNLLQTNNSRQLLTTVSTRMVEAVNLLPSESSPAKDSPANDSVVKETAPSTSSPATADDSGGKDPPPLEKSTPHDAIRTAEQHKQTGNEFFSNKNYRKALGAYHRVFLYLKTLKDPDADEQPPGDLAASLASSQVQEVPPLEVENVRKLKAITWTNMAACYLGLWRGLEEEIEQGRTTNGPVPGSEERPDVAAFDRARTEQIRVLRKAIDVCRSAVALFRTNENDIDGYSRAKPQFRLGQALLLHGGDIDGAIETLTEAARLEPGDRKIRDELAKAKERRKVVEADLRERMRKGFTG